MKNAAVPKQKTARFWRLRVITRSRRTGFESECAALFVPEKFQVMWRYMFDDMTPNEIIKFIRIITHPLGYVGINKSAWTYRELEFLRASIKSQYSKKDIVHVLSALNMASLHEAPQHFDRQKTKHHLRPKARGGKNGNSKIVRFPRKFHEAWHYVFYHLLPEEVVKFVRVLLQGKGLHKFKRRWSKKEIHALHIVIQQNSLFEVTEKIRELFSHK